MGCISEPAIGDVQASWRHVSTNEMTGRKITTPKRDRATDPTSEIENFQIFVCILGLSGLVKYIPDLVFCKIVRRFAGDTDILRVNDRNHKGQLSGGIQPDTLQAAEVELGM